VLLSLLQLTLFNKVTSTGVVEYMRKNGLEVIILCEAIDPLLSGTFVAIHSYTWEDIEVGRTFSNCVECRKVGRKGEKLKATNKGFIDMSKFHDTVLVGTSGSFANDGNNDANNTMDPDVMRRRLTRRDSNINRFIKAAFLN